MATVPRAVRRVVTRVVAVAGAIAVALSVTVTFVAPAGCAAPRPDAAIDQYVNQGFAPAHAKIVAARASYAKISAADIREPGKLEYLRFHVAQIAAPLLAQALAETRALTPPASATWFHDSTLSVLEEESAALAEMAAALSPPSATAFASGHARMMNVQERVFRWEENRDRLIKQAHIKLAPLPKVASPAPTPAGSAALVEPADATDSAAPVEPAGSAGSVTGP